MIDKLLEHFIYTLIIWGAWISPFVITAFLYLIWKKIKYKKKLRKMYLKKSKGYNPAPIDDKRPDKPTPSPPPAEMAMKELHRKIDKMIQEMVSADLLYFDHEEKIGIENYIGKKKDGN